MPHPALTIYDDAVKSFITTDFEIETLSGDCLFTEGPVWNASGYYLFSDIPANVIYKIYESGRKQTYLEKSGCDNPGDTNLKADQVGSNALAYDHNEHLLICQHGNHQVAEYDGQKVTPLITGYKNRSFNSPNDLIIKSDGKIFFSDPPYGLKDGKLNSEKFQPIAGVYAWQQGEIHLICDKYKYPNGVCLSPDEKILYICSNKPFEKFISAYNSDTHEFIRIVATENSDGIECDEQGNIYLCSKEGIIVLRPNGKRMALLELPAVPANLCWGGKGLSDLFITARENVYLIRDFKK